MSSSFGRAASFRVFFSAICRFLFSICWMLDSIFVCRFIGAPAAAPALMIVDQHRACTSPKEVLLSIAAAFRTGYPINQKTSREALQINNAIQSIWAATTVIANSMTQALLGHREALSLLAASACPIPDRPPSVLVALGKNYAC